MFHVKLKAAARRTGLTNRELARRLAVDEATLYRWFRGALPPDGLRACLILAWAAADLADAFEELPEPTGRDLRAPVAGELARVVKEQGEELARLRGLVERLQAALLSPTSQAGGQ